MCLFCDKLTVYKNRVNKSIFKNFILQMTGGTSSETCEGCCEAIYDRFVMRVGNLSWHEDCLFCSDCHTQLINSCYFKESRLLCRMDYEK